MRATRGARERPLQITVSEFGSTHTLELVGELELATVPVLRERLDVALDRGAEVIVIDMSGLEFLDSSGIALLIESHHRLNEQDGARLRLIPSEAPAVARVLRVTDLDRRLRFVDRPPSS